MAGLDPAIHLQMQNPGSDAGVFVYSLQKVQGALTFLGSIGELARMFRSKHLPLFGIPDVEHEVQVQRDTYGLPRLFFRSPGNPLIGLDLTGLSQLQQLLEHDGDVLAAQRVAGYIQQTKQLGIGPSQM